MISRLVILGLIVCMFSACYEKEDGCLDISAANFDVSADNHCCCTYPSLNLTLDKQLGLLEFDSDSLYTNTFGEVFQINEMTWFVSSLAMERADGTLVQISDTLQFSDTGPQNLIIVDDIVQMNITDNPGYFPAGTFRASGAFSKFHFQFGLPNAIDALEISDFPEDSELGETNENMLQNDQFLDLRISLVKNAINNPDTVVYTFTDLEISQTLSATFEFIAGESTNLGLLLDVEDLIQGIQFEIDDDQLIYNQFVTNLSSCIKLAN